MLLERQACEELHEYTPKHVKFVTFARQILHSNHQWLTYYFRGSIQEISSLSLYVRVVPFGKYQFVLLLCFLIMCNCLANNEIVYQWQVC